MVDPEPTAAGVCAQGFVAREVYRSAHRPSYTCWVSFFPGEAGQWYLTCEEVTLPQPPRPVMSLEKWYAFGLPVGYDKSPYQLEIVMLESRDGLDTWREVSRQAAPFQHSAGSFGQARTTDGRFLRTVWAAYDVGGTLQPNDILFASADGGQTWQRQPPLHDPRLVSYPHRLRTLRDGTLVLALPLEPAWGPGTQRPVRTCMDLEAVGGLQMHLCFSMDQGHTWSAPLPIYAGMSVSETDMVELPDGDLLCVNTSIFAVPGRQLVHRWGDRFTPGPFQRSRSQHVPETVCLAADGLLVGCLRNSRYLWSDDMGISWYPLAGVPAAVVARGEMYQPWIHALGAGRIACAGHLGGDNAMGELDHYVALHTFDLSVGALPRPTSLTLERPYDGARGRFANTYVLCLTCGGEPAAGQEVELWWVARDAPGYDSWNRTPLVERMAMGGQLLRATTDARGRAVFALPHLDRIEDVHRSVQMVGRFNADRRDPAYLPAQTLQFEFYANSYQAPPAGGRRP